MKNSPDFKLFPATQCYLEEYIKGDQSQLWTWNEETTYIKNVQTGFYLINDAGILMMADIDHVDRKVADDHFPHEAAWLDFYP